MREIKFRAWVDSNNEGAVMMYCNQNSLCNMTANVSLKSCGDNPPQGHLEYLYKSGYSVMQYTGLQDKNGKDIYEGDIVTHCNWSDLEEPNDFVVFNRGCFMLAKFSQGMGDIELIGSDSLIIEHEINMVSLEVIGNIYQNPELLK